MKRVLVIVMIVAVMMVTGCNEAVERSLCTATAQLTLGTVEVAPDSDALEGLCGDSPCQDGVVDAVCAYLGLGCGCPAIEQ